MELRVIKGLLASLAIHLLLVVAPSFLPKNPNPFQNTSQVEIEILQPQSQLVKTMVRESLLPEQLKVKESEDPLRFFSKDRQRVQKQTRAENSGMTVNAGAQSSKAKNQNLRNFFHVKTHQDSEVSNSRQGRTQASSSLLDLPNGVSRTGEMLPVEVSVGSYTALNTDRYLFYSFFARVEELIRSPWENSVRWTLQNSSRVAFERNVSANWVTEIKVVLKPNGEFLQSIVMKQSGIRGFDQAATQAFAKAKMFPNPPKEMVDADGLIELHYRFNVRVDPRVLGQN